MKRLLASIIIWGVCYIASTAQTIHGVVMNKAGEPIQFVNIVELSRADSSFIGGTVSKDDGKFTLNSVKNDNILRFSCMGYKTTYVNYFGQDSINITLHENASMLGEVIVKSHLPQTRLKGSALITPRQNIRAMLLSLAPVLQSVMLQTVRLVPRMPIEKMRSGIA